MDPIGWGHRMKTGETAAAISGLERVHGIALAPELNKGFISSGGNAMVLVFDLNTHQSLSKINTTGKTRNA